jgi:glycerol-3-phosphate O-acyltransferase/dihydroxyacetone phosphate acyltransferase
MDDFQHREAHFAVGSFLPPQNLVALVVTPIAYGFYTFVVVIISIRKKWILKWKVVAPIVTFCTLVTGSYATMRILESAGDIYK